MMNDIRWKQRFDNYDRSFLLLREALERGLDALSQLEKEGTIQHLPALERLHAFFLSKREEL